jgi:CubicO group peptidase (beta-lactamase class C family)
MDSGVELKANVPLEAIVRDLESLIPRRMSESGVPGLSIALIRDAELVWSKGFGIKSVASKAPESPDTVFSAQSLSKPVFSYVVLKLCEKGLLELDTPLSEYLLESYIPNEPRLNQITARHVLSHTTGFLNWRPKGRPLKVLFRPGSRFSYSGEGFVYLQKVVENLIDQPLSEFVKERLFDPFGMIKSSYVWNDAFEKEAEGHDRLGNALGRPKWTEVNVAASLYSTVEDYSKFVSEVLRASAADEYRLSRNTLEQMVTPQKEVYFSISWGLGWGIQHWGNHNSIWQWGQGFTENSFQSFVIGFPKEKIGAVIMTNSSNGLGICEDILIHSLGGEYPAFADYLARPKTL